MPGGEPVTEAHEALQMRVLEALGEIKGELKAHGVHLEALAGQVSKQNGRVGKIEDWRHIMEVGEARAAGIVAGRTGLARRQVAFITAAVTAASGLGMTAASILSRFVG